MISRVEAAHTGEHTRERARQRGDRHHAGEPGSLSCRERW